MIDLYKDKNHIFCKIKNINKKRREKVRER